MSAVFTQTFNVHIGSNRPSTTWPHVVSLTILHWHSEGSWRSPYQQAHNPHPSPPPPPPQHTHTQMHVASRTITAVVILITFTFSSKYNIFSTRETIISWWLWPLVWPHSSLLDSESKSANASNLPWIELVLGVFNDHNMCAQGQTSTKTSLSWLRPVYFNFKTICYN